MGRVDGKKAFITGGAQGLGEAMAHMLAREGAKVTVTDINGEGAEKVAAAINQAHGAGTAFAWQHDVTDEARWKVVLQEAHDAMEGLNVLVNNAGIGSMASVEDETYETFRKVQAIDVDSIFLGCKYAIPLMRDHGLGSIINISSAMGLVADANLAAYNASKGGVRLFSKSAALHCGQSGYKVRVNSVHPGYIWTPMVSGALATIGDVDEGRKTLDAKHPIGYVGDPNDVAYGILYLASDESKFVTGSELVIDGGYTAQ